jgi:PAS domain S-box-containing protein
MKKYVFAREIDAARDRLEILNRRAASLSKEKNGPLLEALQELSTSLEELQVAGEEMAQQDEELVASREMLESERQKYEELFDFAPDGYFVTDTRGNIREANRAAASLLGVAARMLRDKPLAVFVAPGDREAFEALLTGLAGGESVEEREVYLQPRHGRVFPAGVTVTGRRDRNGALASLLWLVRDVTEHKKKDELARLASFAELNPNPVTEVDLAGHLHYLNPGARAVFPSLETEGLRHPWLAGLTAAAAELKKSGRESSFEEVKVGDDWYERFIYPIMEGRRLRVYGWNITVRKRSEEALRKARDEAEEGRRILDVLMANVPEGITIADGPDMKIRMVSRYGQALLGGPHEGLTAEEVVSQWRVYEKDGRHPLANEDLPLSRAILRGEDVKNQELVQINAAGQRLPLLCNAAPIRDTSGKITGGIVAWQDITELKKNEAHLTRLNRNLEALGRSSRVLTRAKDEAEYLEEVCRIIQEASGQVLVWVGYAENDPERTVRPAAHSGLDEGYLGTLRVSWADSARGRGPTGTAIREGRPDVCRDIRTDVRFKPWRKEALRRGFASSLALPLLAGDGAFAAITILSKEEDAFSPEEIQLLTELAEDLAAGVLSIRLREAHARTEKELIDSEWRYRSLFNGMTEGFALHELICDSGRRPVDYRFLDINPAFERLTGLSRDQVIGRTRNEILPGDDPYWLEAFGRVALTGQPAHFENYSRALGRHYEVYSYRPAPGQFAVLFMDVSGRRKVEEELRRSRDELEKRVRERTADLQRQAELLDLAHDAIIVRGLDGRIGFWNTGAEKMYGWPKSAALGKNISDLLASRLPLPVREIDAEILSRGRWEGELNHTTESGKKILVFSRQVLRRAEDGGQDMVLEINQDVTERRQAEERLHRMQRMEALGTLAGGIAHDINNILSPILLNTELALDDVDPDGPLVRRLSLVLEAAKRGKELVRQIIAFSRQKEQSGEPIDIARVVKEALRFLRASIRRNIAIEDHFDSGSSIVRADPVQIHQVLMNLGANAAHAMRDGEGRMEISLREVNVSEAQAAGNPDLKPGPYVQLTVSDNGGGMSNEVLDRAFDPFFTTKEKGEGSGMGLSVVLGIVRNHGGAVSVASEVGRGTTFDVFLPRLEGEAAVEIPSEKPAPEGTEQILFVDDEEIVLHSVVPALERLGYKVTAKTNALEALRAFRERPGQFDLVITDQTMPFLTGEKLAQEMLTRRPDIPIILCTGFSEIIDEDEARGLGIREFILKPFSIAEIAAGIKRALGKK